MSRKALIEKFAMGQVLSDFPDISFDEIILALENNVEEVVEKIVPWHPYQYFSDTELVDELNGMFDKFSEFADELESL